MAHIPVVDLNNGVQMPQIGYGIMMCKTEDKMYPAVSAAIDAGCRLFDSAWLYRNEALFGAALSEKLKSSGLKRQDVFITSKIRTSMHAYDKVRPALEDQLKTLGLDYLDLYLIHWPMPGDGLYLQAWKAMEKLYEEGLLKAIGVCNCFEKQLRPILDICTVKPAVDQIQCNPYYLNTEVLAFCKENGIQVEGWSPLRKGTVLKDPVLTGIAEAHGRSPAQVTLRWETQRGIIPLPGSTNPVSIKASFDIFDFALTPDEMAQIDRLERRDPYQRKPGAVYDPDSMDHLF